MPAYFVVIDFFLMLVGFLLRADAHVGPVSIEPAERYLDKPLDKVQLKEQRYRNQRIPSVATAEEGYRQDHADNQHLDLLERMGGLMTLAYLRKPVGAILADKDAWPYCQCPESLHWEMIRVFYF